MTSDRPGTTQPFAMIDFVGDNLQPDEIVKLFSLRPVRPKKKGDALGTPGALPAPLAKTGYCGFSTIGCVSSIFMDDHVQFLLDEIDKNIDALEKIVKARSLNWYITCFYDPIPNGSSPDAVSQQTLARAEAYGICITSTSD